VARLRPRARMGAREVAGAKTARGEAKTVVGWQG
jgi:hypothetical protein